MNIRLAHSLPAMMMMWGLPACLQPQQPANDGSSVSLTALPDAPPPPTLPTDGSGQTLSADAPAPAVVPPAAPAAGAPPEVTNALNTAMAQAIQSAASGASTGAGAYVFTDGRVLLDPATIDRPLFFPAGAYYGSIVRNATLEGLSLPSTEVVATNLVLVRDLVVTVSETGEFLVTWQTRDPQPPGTLYYGVTMPDQHFAVPRYRREEIADPGATGLTLEHGAVGSVATLARPSYDMTGLGTTGYGIIEYRVEQYILSQGSSRLYDRRFGVRRDGERWRRVPAVIEGPFVDMPTTGDWVFSFDTDAEVRATVALWNAAEGLRLIDSPSGPATHFEIPVSLPADESFWYAVILRGNDSDVMPSRWYPLRTHAAVSTPFSFAVMSDSRSGVGPGEHAYEGTNMRTLRMFMAAVHAQRASFLVFPGDLIDGYVTEPEDFVFQLQAWKDSSELLGRLIPIYEGMGNHEALAQMFVNGLQHDRMDGRSAEHVFAEQFVNPANGPEPESEQAPPYDENVYSWDWGNSHFVMLNSNYWWSNLYEFEGLAPGDRFNREGYIMDRQTEWLRADLADARARGVQHIFAFTHEPAFPNGGHVEDTMWWSGRIPQVVARRDELVSIFLEYGVLALFTGDEHNYSRTRIDSSLNPAWQGRMYTIVTGGCGAPYYARDTSPPWAGNVEFFSGQQNYVTVNVNGPHATLTVHGESGEILETLRIDNNP